MIDYDSYEEAAIYIQYIYEDRLDKTKTDQELKIAATVSILEEFPDAKADEIQNIVREIMKIYEAVDPSKGSIY